MREELITSAISFLSDPKVQSAPLAKKVSFLESKGMTSEEIEEAMARANGKSSSTAVTTTTTTQPQGAMMVQPQPGMHLQHAPPLPPRPSYDWRDIFIAAVLAGGVSYGVWTLAKVKHNTIISQSKMCINSFISIASLWSLVQGTHSKGIRGRQGKVGCSIPSR
jgi:hypothetical protein